MITKLVALFSPSTWIALGLAVLALAGLQTAFYFWAEHEGVQKEQTAQAKVEAQRVKDIAKLEKDRTANQQAAVIIATELNTLQGRLDNAESAKAQALLAARDAKRKLRDGMRPAGSPDNTGLPDVDSVFTDRADLLAIADRATRTANKNADIANAAFAAIEVDCKLWQEKFGKDVKHCGAGVAQKRYADRVKDVTARAAALKDRIN